MTHIQNRERKSRRDGTLLTVDAIYGRDATCHVSTSPAGTAHHCAQVSSLRDLPGTVTFIFRRINSTVNQVLSLRDISPLTQNLYKLYISYALAKCSHERQWVTDLTGGNLKCTQKLSKNCNSKIMLYFWQTNFSEYVCFFSNIFPFWSLQSKVWHAICQISISK